MITVYGYGFEMPRPPAPPPTPWGMYLLAASAAWWAWTKWGKTARVSNPRRVRVARRRRNPRVRATVGRAVSIPWYGGRKRVLLTKVMGGGRAVVQFPHGNLHNVPTAGLRGVK